MTRTAAAVGSEGDLLVAADMLADELAGDSVVEVGGGWANRQAQRGAKVQRGKAQRGLNCFQVTPLPLYLPDPTPLPAPFTNAKSFDSTGRVDTMPCRQTEWLALVEG